MISGGFVEYVAPIPSPSFVFKMGKEKKEEPEEIRSYEKQNRLSQYNCFSDFITSPVTEFNSSVFKEFVDITIQADSGMEIYYTLNGKNPNTFSQCYTQPLRIDSTVTLKAIAVNSNGKSKSYVTTSHFYKMLHPDWKIKILSKNNSRRNFNV